MIHGMGYTLTGSVEDNPFIFVSRGCELTLSYVTMEGTRYTTGTSARAIYAWGGEISLYSSTFKYFGLSSGPGGALNVDNGGAIKTSKGNTFSWNYSPESGGAIRTTQNETFTSDGDTFNNNKAEYYGGAIRIDSNGVKFVSKGSTFTSNAAGSYGGAVLWEGSLESEGTICNDNYANVS
jgi:predicted outer membrane repeat protein